MGNCEKQQFKVMQILMRVTKHFDGDHSVMETVPHVTPLGKTKGSDL